MAQDEAPTTAKKPTSHFQVPVQASLTPCIGRVRGPDSRGGAVPSAVPLEATSTRRLACLPPFVANCNQAARRPRVHAPCLLGEHEPATLMSLSLPSLRQYGFTQGVAEQSTGQCNKQAAPGGRTRQPPSVPHGLTPLRLFLFWSKRKKRQGITSDS
jgi:hypothetical protein